MPKQYKLFKDSPKAYGGDLLTKRKARLHGRPLDTRNTMHLVLRSSKAQGTWSFKEPLNEIKISKIITKFAFINGINILSMANVGNHLHLQIKLSHRFGYNPFIRAITAAIAMAVTGRNRWTKKTTTTAKSLEVANSREKKWKFWDCRPFTRVVQGYRALLNLKDYIQINILEGFGCQRSEAKLIWAQRERLINTS